MGVLAPRVVFINRYMLSMMVHAMAVANMGDPFMVRARVLLGRQKSC